jgi:hypothetical protein
MRSLADLTALTALPADAGRYIHWGVISISLTNLLVIVAMVVVFVLALVLPFPRPHDRRGDHPWSGS